MKCKNKEIQVIGFKYDDEKRTLMPTKFTCIVTNDEKGKTLSIDDGRMQFTIPFENLEKWLR